MAEQNSYDFWTRYSNLCLKCKVCPLKSVIKFMRGTILFCPVERIRSEHWQFLLSALSVDNSLTEVCFKSYLPPLEDQKELWKKRRRKNDESYPIPYGYSPHNISDICKYSNHLLTNSQTLQVIIFENLPITKEDAEHLAGGLQKSLIKEFAFRCYPYSDEVIEIICRGLWDSKISLLDFSACNLSLVGLKFICKVITKHEYRRTVDTFPETLRHGLPMSEGMMGLTRVILNGNNIGDKGAEIICDTVYEDKWIQALDLQHCGITNEGAIALLKLIAANNSIQLIDLRLNDIDNSILERISVQLGVNSFGKSINYIYLPLWKPRSYYMKSLPARKNKLKTKIGKKYSKNRVFRKETRGLGHAVEISCQILDSKDTSTEEVAVQTDGNFDIKYLQERVRGLELRLLKEMSMRDSLMDLMERFKFENTNLRQELIKLTTYDDVILIDQETYAEIKHVFEKFQRFLKLMKDHGLWGLVLAIGIDDYEKTKLKAVPSDSKMFMISREHPPPDGNGPINPPPVPKPQTRCCSCRKPECISNQKAEKDNTSNSNRNATTLDKTQLKNTVEEARVAKVLEDMKEALNHANNFKPRVATVPPLTKKLSSGDLLANIKSSKQSPVKSASSSDVPNKFKQIKTRQDLYEAVKSEMERIECMCQLHKISLSPERSHFSLKNQNVANKSFFKNVSSQTAAVDSIANFKSKKVNPVSLSGSTASILSQKSAQIASKLHSTAKSFSPEQYIHEAVNRVSQEWEEHVKKNFPDLSISRLKPTATVEDSTNPIVNPDYFKTSKVQLKQNLPAFEHSHGSSKISALSQMVHSMVEGSPSTTNKEGNSSVASSIENTASELDLKSKSSQTSNKSTTSKSYLESVSDASTDKDFKSITVSEVIESVKGKGSGSFSLEHLWKSNKEQRSVSGSVGGKSSASNSTGNSSIFKSSKKNQKQKKKSNQNTASSGKVPKDNASNSSVPPLSDITTVSSHSLNTDSVMGKLSDSDKGLSS